MLFNILISCNKNETVFAPTHPYNPVPTDNSVEVPRIYTVRWKCFNNKNRQLKYELYFGTSLYPLLLKTELTDTAYTTDLLEKTTKYYWKIIVKDDKGHAVEGDIWSFQTCDCNIPIIDIDGNSYQTVKIGTQTWMSEDLKTTKYRDGTLISNIAFSSEWSSLITGAYCNYDNDVNNSTDNGKLYNWFAVNDKRGLCPEGWHVPSDAEWTTLTDFLGGENIAGGKMKEAGIYHWISPNIGATNESGFSAFAGGRRSTYGSFFDQGSNSYWWSASSYDDMSSWYNELRYNYTDCYVGYAFNNDGFNVRCLQDNK